MIKQQIVNDLKAVLAKGATEIRMYSLATSNMLLSWEEEHAENYNLNLIADAAIEDPEDYVLKAVINGRLQTV